MTFIQTATGLRWNILEPDPDDVFIEDIAHALSMQCRFNGHVNHFYSVAQHSVIVSVLLAEHGPAMQLTGLLHDAAEAYIGDMVSPLKSCLPMFKTLEEMTLEAIFSGLGLSDVVPHWDTPLIHSADRQMLYLEGMELKAEGWKGIHESWASALPDLPKGVTTLPTWCPVEAEAWFLDKFMQLTEEL